MSTRPNERPTNDDTTPKIVEITEEPNQPDETKRVEHKYAILMETNPDEFESWYYFIRYDGNEEALKYLEDQLNTIEWYAVIDEDISTFVIETQILVSEQTAKEMTKVDLNSQTFHRKFDGKLEKIELNLDRVKKPKKKSKDRHDEYNENKMAMVTSIIGYGKIERFIDMEDVDEDEDEDEENDDECEDTAEEESNENENDEEKDSESKEDSTGQGDEEETVKQPKKYAPPNAIPRPRWARAKGRRRN